MVERVSRGRIMLPAAAALGFLAVGVGDPDRAFSADRHAILQMRVQVVEACQLRVSSRGAVDQDCIGRGIGRAVPIGPSRNGDRIASPMANERSLDKGVNKWAAPVGGGARIFTIEPAERFDGANQRANALAKTIANRVRYITVVY